MTDRNTLDTHEYETNRTDMSRRTLLRTVGATGLATPLLAGMASADDATVTRLDATVKRVEKPTRIREYPTYDADYL
jgi:hypothetical protein